MAIRCGNHGREVVYHATVEGVRSCCAGSPVMGIPLGAGSPKLVVVASHEITEGMWRVGERIFKVQIAHHGSGQLYAKELIVEDGSGGFQMFRGGMSFLRKNPETRRMTLEEAVQFGKLYGFCCRCGTILTNEDSIEAGIGPVCAGKFS